MNYIVRWPARLGALIATSSLAFATSIAWLDADASFRSGYDSNLFAITKNVVEQPHEDSAVLSAGFSATANLTKAGLLEKPWANAKLSWATDVYNYASEHSENYTTHRLTLAAKRDTGAETLTIDGSLLYIDGTRSTELSTTSCNAYGLAAWRERREQWQERAKVQWTHLPAPLGWRVTGSLVSYELGTNVQAGHVIFTDRRDASAGAELGAKFAGGTAWLGAQVGRQHQGAADLPGTQFEYSNHYRRLTLSWSGQVAPALKLNLTGGPDWRDYDGLVNPAVMTNRIQSSWFVDSDATWTLSPSWSLTGKITRSLWLSSTGKTAYVDACYEAGANWKISPQWLVKLGTKLAETDFFPLVRDDYLAAATGSVDWTVNAKFRCGVDLQHAYGWSHVQPVAGRDFRRTLVTLRGTVAF